MKISTKGTLRISSMEIVSLLRDAGKIRDDVVIQNVYIPRQQFKVAAADRELTINFLSKEGLDVKAGKSHKGK